MSKPATIQVNAMTDIDAMLAGRAQVKAPESIWLYRGQTIPEMTYWDLITALKETAETTRACFIIPNMHEFRRQVRAEISRRSAPPPQIKP
jgi:hypothetical protein